MFSILLVVILSTWSLGEILPNEEKDSISNAHRSIIFISDTQSPMWFEKIFVKTHRNKEATKILLNTIASDSTVSLVFFLGDVTSMSSFNHNWVTIDSFLMRLKVTHVLSYATAGNHDYLLSSNEGETNLRKRFPNFRRTGYTVQDGSFAIILLNSNFGELSPSEKMQQQKWYLNELLTLEQDSTIKIVTVGCHHSPFSNSTIVGHSQQVRDEFVPPFMKSSKCRLFISGHAHTFQYFKDSVVNKHFLVIGGGGGLLHTLKAGEPGELQDQVRWNTHYRMFHFVQGTFTANGFLLTVLMLTEDLKGPQPVYKVFIPFNSL